MRTYTRKRVEYSEIDGVQDLCRLCLGKTEEAQQIFTEENDNMCSVLALRIMICVGLQVTKEDNLPNLICKECFKELEKYYNFRKKCEVSYKKLKSHILALKDKQYKEEARIKEEKQNELSNEVENVDKKQNLMYTVNMDGSIQLCDSNSLNCSEPLVKLMKMDSLDMPSVVQIGKDMSSNEIQAIASNKNETVPSDTDFSPFVSSMLVDLGILTQQADDLVVLESSSRTIELETGDGSFITLQLVQEEEEQENHIERTLQSTIKPDKETDEAEETPLDTTKGQKTGIWQARSVSQGAYCNMCNKSFATRSVAARHARDVHARSRPHQCAHCGKSFAQKQVMLRHQLVHQETRPFQCSQCPKSFTQRAALDTHRRLHAPPDARHLELHQCHRCQKVFLYSSGLSRHIAAAHTGKVYRCGQCARPFKDRSSYLRHSRLQRHRCGPPTTTTNGGDGNNT